MATADVVIAFDARLGNLEAATKRITTSLNQLDRTAKDTQRSVSAMSSSMTSAFTSMGRELVGFAAGVLTVERAMEAFKEAFRFADELGDMAEQVGVSVGELQTFQLAVINAGGSSEKAGKGLAKLGEAIGEASRGGEDAANKFVKLGISYQHVDGSARSTTEVLQDLAKKLDETGTHQEKLSIAADLFGAKLAPAMVVALANVGAQLGSTATEAERMNRVLSQDTVNAVGKVDDAMNVLGMTINTELTKVIAAVAPQLESFFKWLTEQVIGASTGIRRLAGAVTEPEKLKSDLDMLREAARLDAARADTPLNPAISGRFPELFPNRGMLSAGQIDAVALDKLIRQKEKEQADIQRLIALDTKFKAEDAKTSPLAKPGSNLKPKAEKKEGQTGAEKEMERQVKLMEDFAAALEKTTRLPLEQFQAQISQIGEAFASTGGFQEAGGVETFLRGVLEAGKKAAEALDAAGMSTDEAVATMKARLLELSATFEEDGIGAVDDWAQRVTKAMDDVKGAADKSLAKDLKGVMTSWGSAIEKSFTGIIDGTVKTADAFENMAKAILDSLATLVARQFILKPLEAALDPILEKLGKLGISGIFGGASAMGNVFSGGHMLAYAQGGIVNRPTLFPMARGVGLMGEAGPEGILPLSRSASGRLGVDASGMNGSAVTVNVVNAAPNTATRAEERQTRNGKEISIFIEQAVQEGIANGRFDKSFSANFGVNRRGRY